MFPTVPILAPLSCLPLALPVFSIGRVTVAESYRVPYFDTVFCGVDHHHAFDVASLYLEEEAVRRTITFAQTAPLRPSSTN